MLALLVVLPCLVIGAAAVVVLDRRGVLSGFESRPTPGGPGDGTFLERVPKGALVAGMAAMAVWILAWLVLLVVGLSVLAR